MEPSHAVKQGIEELNVTTNQIGNNTYLLLYHGTTKGNQTKIIKSGKFKAGTFFTPDEKTALRYASMTGNRPAHLFSSINADGLTFNGYFFIAKQDLIYDQGHYEPKNPPVMESFIKSLKRLGNESLIESIIEGYNVIFEETIGPVYHGTGKEFYEFKPHQKRQMQMGFGIHFTPDPKFAELYKRGKKGRVIKANLNINKLFDAEQIYTLSSEIGQMLYEMNKKFHWQCMDEECTERGAYGHRVIDSVTPQRAEKILRKHGYDGVKYVSKMQGAGLHSVHTRAATIAEAETYIVFDNSQIKQIDNLNESITLIESKHYDLNKLKKNKIPLTDEERKEVFKKDAVWAYASSIDPNTGKKVQKVSAVWKAKDSDGKIVYITNTHRAASSAKSLNAIINKYHNFIKGTA